MEKITSFTIDHIKLQPGVYVSRKDPVGDQVITTFDIRMTSPNEEPVMNTAELHAMEHLAATFLRNHKEFGPKVIYWGPMGCRTGNYLLLNGDYESRDIVPLMIEMFEFIRDFEGEIPGASAKDCGNYLDMNPGMENIHVATGDLLKGVTQEADVIVANILADILIHLTEDAYRLVKDEGYLIMSGIISEKWDMVREWAEKAGFLLETHMVQGEWNACVFKKTDDISGVIGG